MLDEGSLSVSLNQIKMWVMPQMGEEDPVQPAIIDLLAKGYITSSLYNGIEDGDDQMFRLTVKGGKCVEELIAATVEQ